MQCKNSKYKTSQGTSYMQLKKNSTEIQATCSVKIAEALYNALVTCMKEMTENGYHKVQDAWNVKASARGFHKVQVACNVKKARSRNCKMKVACILKKSM